MSKFKRCPECGATVRYRNIFELYQLNDNHAVWSCLQCHYQEEKSLDWLLLQCQTQKPTTLIRSR